MRTLSTVRSILFRLAVAAGVLSSALLVGSFARHVQATDYLAQGAEGVPWVQWGLGSALVAFILAFVGKGLPRLAMLALSLPLFVLWYLMGLSLF